MTFFHAHTMSLNLALFFSREGAKAQSFEPISLRLHVFARV